MGALHGQPGPARGRAALLGVVVCAGMALIGSCVERREPDSPPGSTATSAPVDGTEPTAPAGPPPGESSEVNTVDGELIDATRDRHVPYRVFAPVGAEGDDRPAEVTFLLDELDAGAVALPVGFGGTPDLDRDGRVDAIAPISPQGAGQFGAFDNGPDDNTWASVTIPAYSLVGSDEVDTNARGTARSDRWRLVPFSRYPGTADTFLTVIDGQDHNDMWTRGSPEVGASIAENILRFMDTYVADDPDARPCAIGDGAAGVPTDSRVASCRS